MISVDTIMVLINGIFFKGNWMRSFKKTKTSTGNFEKFPGEQMEIEFMSQRDKYHADKDSYLGAKWMSLPFQVIIFRSVERTHTHPHAHAQSSFFLYFYRINGFQWFSYCQIKDTD